MRLLILLLLFGCGLAQAAPLDSKVVARLTSADGKWTALLRNTWERWGPGPDYPVRCEILMKGSDGRERKVHEFLVPSKSRRQYVKMVGWDGSDLLVTHREAPFKRMSEDAVTSLRSTLWHISPTAPPRPWKRGGVTAGGILDVRHGRVCLGLDGEVGGGAGYPPYLDWRTLLITDLEGVELHRLKDLEANDLPWVEHCLSPDARFVATYTVAPSMDVATLVVRAVDGSLTRSIPTPGLFRWTGATTLKAGDPPRIYDVVKGW